MAYSFLYGHLFAFITNNNKITYETFLTVYIRTILPGKMLKETVGVSSCSVFDWICCSLCRVMASSTFGNVRQYLSTKGPMTSSRYFNLSSVVQFASGAGFTFVGEDCTSVIPDHSIKAARI